MPSQSAKKRKNKNKNKNNKPAEKAIAELANTMAERTEVTGNVESPNTPLPGLEKLEETFSVPVSESIDSKAEEALESVVDVTDTAADQTSPVTILPLSDIIQHGIDSVVGSINISDIVTTKNEKPLESDPISVTKPLLLPTCVQYGIESVVGSQAINVADICESIKQNIANGNCKVKKVEVKLLPSVPVKENDVCKEKVSEAVCDSAQENCDNQDNTDVSKEVAQPVLGESVDSNYKNSPLPETPKSLLTQTKELPKVPTESKKATKPLPAKPLSPKRKQSNKTNKSDRKILGVFSKKDCIIL